MRVGRLLLVTMLVALAAVSFASAADKKPKDEVLKASEKFYAALNKMANGDASEMAVIWSHSANVTTMHPIGGRQVGYDEVRGSWEKVAKIATDGKIELTDQLVRVVGNMAYEIGIEHGQFKLSGHEVSIEGRVTNIYEKEAGAWKIVHHHTDLSQAMLDVLKELPAPAAGDAQK